MLAAALPTWSSVAQRAPRVEASRTMLASDSDTTSIALRVRMLVRGPVRVAVQMKVRTSGVRVRVQVPASTRVAQDYGPTERDQEQRDQEVGRRPEAVGKMQPEQDDRAHHQAHARGMTQRPREAQAASVEQAALPGRERRHGREVVRLERVTEAQQQAEAGEGEKVGRGGTHDGSQFTLTILSCAPTISLSHAATTF